MNNVYENLKEFWNTSFKNQKPESINSKWCNEESFNNLITKYILSGSTVLDFGCGSGWACFEINFTVSNLSISGIDQSLAAIEYCSNVRDASNLENISFEKYDGLIRNELKSKFDCAVSFNVIDVVPDDIVNEIIIYIKSVVKKDGYILLGINPDYPYELLQKHGYTKEDRYLFKDGILRGNLKTDSEWISLLKEHFDFVEETKISLTENERQFPRRVFVFRNSK